MPLTEASSDHYVGESSIWLLHLCRWRMISTYLVSRSNLLKVNKGICRADGYTPGIRRTTLKTRALSNLNYSLWIIPQSSNENVPKQQVYRLIHEYHALYKKFLKLRESSTFIRTKLFIMFVMKKVMLLDTRYLWRKICRLLCR